MMMVFGLKKIKDDQKAVYFYTGFPSMELLMVCFTFLGKAVSELPYRDHYKLTKGKPHKLSLLNKFFDGMSLTPWVVRARSGL